MKPRPVTQEEIDQIRAESSKSCLHQQWYEVDEATVVTLDINDQFMQGTVVQITHTGIPPRYFVQVAWVTMEKT